MKMMQSLQVDDIATSELWPSFDVAFGEAKPFALVFWDYKGVICRSVRDGKRG